MKRYFLNGLRLFLGGILGLMVGWHSSLSNLLIACIVLGVVLFAAERVVGVQAVCEDALEGLFPECWNCGTAVHDGPCVGEGE